MPEDKAAPANALHSALMKKVSDGKGFDFQGLAQVVADHGGSIFENSPEDLAKDYVVWGVSSVAHAWHNLQGTVGRGVDPAVLQKAQCETLGK